jgi:hypothetical protein
MRTRPSPRLREQALQELCRALEQLVVALAAEVQPYQRGLQDCRRVQAVYRLVQPSAETRLVVQVHRLGDHHACNCDTVSVEALAQMFQRAGMHAVEVAVAEANALNIQLVQ